MTETEPIEPAVEEQAEETPEEPTEIDYKEVAQRATADYRNLQRETDERLKHIRQFANEDLLQELCPLVDYFDSAFQAIPPEQLTQPWLQGVKHIQTYLLQVLKNHSVERMETVGKPFDPHLHEAVGEEASEQPDQTIVREAQAGFMMHDKVIRHAKVIVAKK
ncbi:MAG: nucleotide exchange factor GrpE [Patescibacteria group bacterium]|jgi:molecular chaperone GrpE